MIPYEITDEQGRVAFGVREDGQLYHRADLTLADAIRLGILVIMAMRDRLEEKVRTINAIYEAPGCVGPAGDPVEAIYDQLHPRSSTTRGDIHQVLQAIDDITERSYH